MRTDQTYYAVMQSPYMTDPLKQIYHALWTAPLTKGEVKMACMNMGLQDNPGAPWEKQVGVLAKMGLAKRGDKRHCKAKNKPDVVWELTDLSAPVRPKATKPSAKAYTKAVAQLETVIALHDQAGDGLISPELRKLYEWVRDKVAEPTAPK